MVFKELSASVAKNIVLYLQRHREALKRVKAKYHAERQMQKNGENVDSFDLARQTALHWAARKGTYGSSRNSGRG